MNDKARALQVIGKALFTDYGDYEMSSTDFVYVSGQAKGEPPEEKRSLRVLFTVKAEGVEKIRNDEYVRFALKVLTGKEDWDY